MWTQKRHWPPPFLLLLLLMLISPLVLFNATPGQAQPLNQFFEIYSPDPVMYDMYQMKFTYLGSQKKTVLSLGLSGMARPFDQTLFQPWEVDYDYSNDEVMGQVIQVPGPDWQFFMDTISTDPVLQSTDRIPDPTCSLMIQTDSMGPPMCWEHLATTQETDQLFQILHDSIQDPAQKEIIDRFRRQMAGVRR